MSEIFDKSKEKVEKVIDDVFRLNQELADPRNTHLSLSLIMEYKMNLSVKEVSYLSGSLLKHYPFPERIKSLELILDCHTYANLHFYDLEFLSSLVHLKSLSVNRYFESTNSYKPLVKTIQLEPFIWLPPNLEILRIDSRDFFDCIIDQFPLTLKQIFIKQSMIRDIFTKEQLTEAFKGKKLPIGCQIDYGWKIKM